MELPGYGGAYLLVINVARRFSTRIGALGRFTVDAGVYVYAGSAKKSIAGRVKRHLRSAAGEKVKPHWHIDYLLINKNVSIAGVLAYKNADECMLASKISGLKGSTVPFKGFGAGDCRNRCAAHLFKVNDEKDLDELKSDEAVFINC